ncbi:MAG: type II secretion system protein GspG [Burkholderiaceae bacterium]|nr:MAG: type II secretion system protein GspG [Burkholderiaceae bacterium]
MQHPPPQRLHSYRFGRGFTLIELLIVMVILGLLASLVGPRLFGQLDSSKIKAARTQIEMVSGALDTYRLDMSRYPTSEQGLPALFEKPSDPTQAARWRGPYLKKRVDKDPWGNSYVYKSPGEKAEFELSSLGADGQEGGTQDNADIHSWE